jgi:putative oxidoreductase
MSKNFRNKYLVNTVRIFLGLFMIFSGVSGLLMVQGDLSTIPPDMMPPEMLPIMQALLDSGIFYMIKVTEVVAGVMLVANFLPALAALFLAPVFVGVVVFNAATAPQNLVFGIVFALLNAYLGYVYWDKYKALFIK